MNQPAKTVLMAGGVFALAVWAVAFAFKDARHIRGGGEDGARIWFYDQAAQKLYTAPRGMIPPEGSGDARVRAVVIGFRGVGNDAGQLKIAYLEKFSPEFKSLLERAEKARANGQPFLEKIPAQNSAYYQANTFIKRAGESAWQTAGSPEARQIMTEWRQWRGPAGQTPIISVPSME